MESSRFSIKVIKRPNIVLDKRVDRIEAVFHHFHRFDRMKVSAIHLANPKWIQNFYSLSLPYWAQLNTESCLSDRLNKVNLTKTPINTANKLTRHESFFFATDNNTIKIWNQKICDFAEWCNDMFTMGNSYADE